MLTEVKGLGLNHVMNYLIIARISIEVPGRTYILNS